MISPVSSTSEASDQNLQKPAPQAAPQQKPQAAPSDTVTLSPAAQLRQELGETPAQTANEARGGDIQAKHLLAREARR